MTRTRPPWYGFRFMHVRGLQPLISFYKIANFDSCMRGNCNIICAAVPTSLKDFDSCMRKDCNAFISLLSPSTSDFDSCMREDCNKVHEGLSLDLPILIHACARIATSDWRRLIRHSIISIHACAKIATILSKKVIHNVRYFNSCMREGCNCGAWP